MRAMVVTEGQLALEEVETPEPQEGEVRIRVVAAGVNRPDLLQRAGKYPPPPGASPILGLEVSGEVDAVGSAVWDLEIGDQVCALLAGGGYATHAVAPAAQCIRVPETVDLPEAAALPEALFTVWANLFDAADLRPGERVLIHGGSSGIGTTAIQMARLAGAEVYTTAGTEERARRCEELGANLAVVYRNQDFVEKIRDHLEDSHPLHVVLDLVGGETLRKNLSLLQLGGRHVSIGVMGGSEATIPIFEIMRRRLKLTGSTLRSRSVGEKGRLRDALLERAWPWVESGRLRPQISHRLALSQAGRAHQMLQSSEHFGKVILLPGESP